MLCIIRHETDPYFNLAAEEYVMEHFDRDCFMLWRNAPAVIVGRHQNTLAEINAEYVREHNDAVNRLDVIPTREEISVDYEPGETIEVALSGKDGIFFNPWLLSDEERQIVQERLSEIVGERVVA